MKPHRIAAILLSLLVCSRAPARAQDIDTELTKLTESLADQIKDHGNKKVTVLDFTDLDGNASEIGKYAAEQMTVDFVMKKREFSVLDRANLKRIMDEHQLTASGLVDPDNAKKLGQFAGVDAMIFGKIVPAGTKVNVTATIVTTDTAEIIGGGKASFNDDSTIQQLKSAQATNTSPTSRPQNGSGGTSAQPDLSDDKPKVVKTFGNLVVELQSLRILRTGQYLLTMTLTNRSARDSLWVALSTTHFGASNESLISPNGFQFGETRSSGLLFAQIHMQYGNPMYEAFNPATEIKPGDSTTVTLAFSSSEGRPPSPGVCTLQLQFLLGDDFLNNSAKRTSSPNLVTKFEAK
jgi:TolB-like protein